MYSYWVNQGNCAISIWCVYWRTRCTWGWIFLQQYVITFCVTITKCAHVGLRVATEFDFTSVLLVWHMTRYKLIPNLWRLHLSWIISHHHNKQVLFAWKDKEWKVSLKVIFLFSCLCSLWHIYRDGYRYVAVIQDCLQLLSWFMNNGQFLFLLYAWRIFPDKKMESTIKRKLSLWTFLRCYGTIFCRMWRIMCRKCDT
jgi:hypothetical protein